MKLGRWLFGFRDDVDLDQRWWHRLTKVIFALVGGLAALVVATSVHDDEVYKPRESMVRIRTNLHRFTKSESPTRNRKPTGDPAEINSIPAFLELPGELGGVDSGGRINFVSQYALGKEWCGNTDVEVVGEGTKPAAVICTAMADIPYDPIKIVKYERTSGTSLQGWAIGVGQASMWVGLGAVTAMNLYYRGLVFIICGPRKRRSEASGSV